MHASATRFLEDLIAAPSPSGYEQPAASIFRDQVKSYADDVSTDVHGSVTAVINPAGSTRIMLAGHADEIGFIIHYIGDDGLLYFSPIGGHDSVIPVGQTVWVHGRTRTPGVIGRKAIHLLDPEELKQKPQIKDLWIDIGATSRAEAETFVELGSVATYQFGFQRLAGDRAAGRGLDNKAGLVVVAEALRLLREEGGLHPGTSVYSVATVQEEIGSRGAQTSAFRIRPQTAIVVDMGHAIDYPGVSRSQHGDLQMGKGPGISRGANTNPEVFRLLKLAAEEEKVPYQISVTPGATPTDAKALQVAGVGVATGLLEVPLRYMHTPTEVVSLSDIEEAARLMAAYCRRVTPETDFTPS
jgi:endoglucanase